VFQNCKILARKPLSGQSDTITTEGREGYYGDGGFIILNCTITAAHYLLNQNIQSKHTWADHGKTTQGL